MLWVTLTIAALSSLAYLALPGVAPEHAGTVTCAVERITDGDTIRCGGERVRLLLIDAPEVDQGPFGRAAQAFLEAILPVGSEALLTFDVERRDRYDRVLAYAYRPDGRMANHMMARQGFAVPLVVPPNVRHVESIRAAADSARDAGLGLWAVDAFACLPETFRDGLCGATSVGGEQSPLLRRVQRRDPHRFDGDRDGIGCEGR